MSAAERLAGLRREDLLSPLDEGFATTMGRLVGEAAWPVVLAAALASRAVSEGDVCVDLAEHAGKTLGPSEICPELAEWLAELRASALVASDEAGVEVATPLVLDRGGRLYLRRYWEHERSVVRGLLERATAIEEIDVGAGVFDGEEDEQQRRAVMIAATRRLCVVTGGPGTGKTTTVARILRVFHGRARVAVAAPTGKAAARLNAALAGQGVAARAETIHRLLGARGGEIGRFRHDAGNPHPADVVVVDEASMVPLALMARLLRGLRPKARLVLLGDRDQLSSVEAGAVLGDLCNQGRAIDPAATLAPAIVVLEKSHRFDAASGIGALAAAIRSGDAKAALAALENGGASIRRVAPPRSGLLAAEIATRAAERWSVYASSADAAERLRAFDGFRLLCALRVGPEGVIAANEAIERLLARRGLLHPVAGHYDGRPLLVLRNDYETRLFNGDVGIVTRVDGRLVAAFPASEGGPRLLSTSLVPPHETAFAMTVHKSQGSEFDEVAVVLPSEASPVVTRELLYTAVTRARQSVVIQASPEALARAIATPTARRSGLRDALWG